METVRDWYERRPEVRLTKDMRLHREVVLSRQADLMPQALAGDVAAQQEMAGLSELTRSFTNKVNGVFAHVLEQEMADRRQQAAEHAKRFRAAPPPDPWVAVLNDNGVFMFGALAGGRAA